MVYDVEVVLSSNQNMVKAGGQAGGQGRGKRIASLAPRKGEVRVDK